MEGDVIFCFVFLAIPSAVTAALTFILFPLLPQVMISHINSLIAEQAASPLPTTVSALIFIARWLVQPLPFPFARRLASNCATHAERFQPDR